jgi:hypothetical protein
LIINNTSGVTLEGTLTVTRSVLASSGNLATGGYLTLASTATQTAYIDGTGSGQVIGNVTMQRYLPSGFGYRYISSPFQTAQVNELSDEVNLAAGFPPVYRYDENRTSSGWVSYVNPSSILNPLQGYAVNFGIVAAPLTFDITDTVNNGSFTTTLYNHDYTYTRGMNLVGNPYPSAIDWDATSGWTKTNIDDAVYFFSPSDTDQYVGTYNSYVNGESSDSIVSNIIPSMQGFFIHVSNGSFPVSGTFGLNNSVRINDMSQPFSKSQSKGDHSVIRLTAAFSTDLTASDPMLVYIDDMSTELFDSKFDGLKLFNTDLKVPNIYSISSDNQRLSINALPSITEPWLRIPLGLKANTEGTVLFRMRSATGSFAGLPVSLYDAVAGTNQPLTNGGQYSVYLPVAEYLNRFFLDVNNVMTGTEGPDENAKPFFAWVSDGILKTDIFELQGNNGTVYLTNLTGQRLLERKVYETGYHEFGIPVKDGVYFITLVSGSKRTVQKFVITR